MKILVVFLATVAIAFGAVDIQLPETIQGRSLSSIVVDAIEAFKLQMPCGLPEYGIPVLAPLRTSYQKISINGESVILDEELMDFALWDLDNFEIVEFQINVALMKVKFRFDWHSPHLVTDYNMWLQRLFGANMNVQRKGPAKFGLKDLTVWGEIKYRISLSRRLTIRSIDIRASVGDVNSQISNLSNNRIMNKMMNGIIEEWLMMVINENEEQMAALSDKHLTPLANRIIGGRKIDDIIAWITGGGSGQTPFDGEQCVPPTNDVQTKLA